MGAQWADTLDDAEIVSPNHIHFERSKTSREHYGQFQQKGCLEQMIEVMMIAGNDCWGIIREQKHPETDKRGRCEQTMDVCIRLSLCGNDDDDHIVTTTTVASIRR